MGYMHIDNLYKNQDVLLFREVYCLEKIHGTSANISWKDGQVKYFAGGSSHELFIKLFDEVNLVKVFTEINQPEVMIYGEAYGGKLQGMKETYGDSLKFVAFDVQIGDSWLSVPSAEQIVKQLGLEFVDYVRTLSDISNLDKERDKPSTQSIRNGCGNDKMREGIVIRPIEEVRRNNNKRFIAKHKRLEFSETKTKRDIIDPDKIKVLKDAKEAAEEFVTEMRMTHILDKIPKERHQIENMREIITAMTEDVMREGRGELLENKETRSAISSRTAHLFKIRIMTVKGEL